MGSPTKSQVESWTDAVAAVIQKDLSGYVSEYGSKTTLSLFDLVDASGDPYVEGALSAPAFAVDQQSIPANHGTVLASLFNGRLSLRGFVNALNTLVTSTNGGAYASLSAYLQAVSCKLHPLAGELIKAILGEAVFGASGAVLNLSNPTYAAIFPSHVYTGADGALVDETTDMQSATTADVPFCTSNTHSLYVTCDRPFSQLIVALSTAASATITPAFSYWNGSAWTTLTVTDNTSGMQQADSITWTPPTDWTPHYKDAGGTAFPNDSARYYAIKITRANATAITPPVGTCVTVVPTAIAGPATGSHLGIPQPPLAIVRITGTDAIAVSLPANVDLTRFTPPLGTESKLRLRALTAISDDVTFTLAYTQGDGSTAGSTAQSAWTAPAALGTKTLALTGAQTLSAVKNTSTATTVATIGVFAVEALPIRTPAV